VDGARARLSSGAGASLRSVPRGRTGAVERDIVFGDRTVRVRLPDDAHVVSPGLALPLEPVADLAAAVREALAAPLDLPPLRDLARGRRRVTVAFDDPTVPCYAPVWSTAIPAVLGELEAAGVRPEDTTLVCANALHRQFTRDELATILGDDLVRAAGDRLVCHDAEDEAMIERLGVTPGGFEVELSRRVTDADLVVYVNCSTTRGFSGGWKSICVGLSTYRSIRQHHTPDDMSMSTERNRMHEVLDEMGRLVVERLGPDRIFKLETVLPTRSRWPGSWPDRWVRRGGRRSSSTGGSRRPAEPSSPSGSTSSSTASPTGAPTRRSPPATRSSRSCRRASATSGA
jgi:hypothetical protein